MAGVAVVDASLVGRWIYDEAHHREARALLRVWQQNDMQVLVPALFASELTAILLKGRRKGALTYEQALTRLQYVLSIVTISFDDAVLATRALEIADALGLWKAYDSLYLALAESEGCEFWTGDERFYNVAHAAFPLVRWVGQAPVP